ncbi:MAG: response regulator transcription factor [Anaerolineaceae bacterium]|nr:response regulator transcription factor [Anaerolineaceae bacterium]
MENKNIRILLVDDHAVVRSGLSAFLLAYEDFELVGECSNGKEAVAMSDSEDIDVILMDMKMPEMDGPTATKIIREKHPDIQVIALTSFKEDDLVKNALKTGAIGYLLKNVSADDLANAIRSAFHGKTTLAPEAAQVLVRATQQPIYPVTSLTDREKEVLVLMVEGLRNPEIAQKLVISQSTVKFHVSSILAKLNVSSRTEAVSVAIKQKLV